MPNQNNSLSLDTAARSDPRDNRLIFQWFENGQCFIEVQDCFDIGALTYTVNGDTETIVCTNLRTGENEVIGTIDTGSTKQATFDLSRYLPADHLSSFFRRVEQNCGLRMYVARGDECLDPYNPNEFSALDIYGPINFGNYTRTEMRHKDKSEATAIMEGSTVTAYDLTQVGKQEFAVRGELAVNPLVAMCLADQKSCGGLCADDSDGCQKWFVSDATGQVLYTTNQFFSEALVPNVPTLDTGNIVSMCCLRGQLVLLEAGSTNGGQIHIASLDIILDGGAPTWTTIAVDVNADNIASLNDCQVSPDGFTLWMVGDGNTLYQYNPVRRVVTPVPTVASLTVDYSNIDILGETIVIVGNNDIVIRSQDGGRSFQLVAVIDPNTGVQTAGIDFTSADILNDSYWEVTTNDGRVLWTLDDGVTWGDQVIPNNPGTAVNDVHTDDQWISYMVQGTQLFKSYYSPACAEFLELPEGPNPLPENGGLVKVLSCPDDSNMFVAIGETVAGAGMVLVGTANYK